MTHHTSSPSTSLTLSASDTALLVIDVQDRINAVMATDGHVARIEVLLEACAALGVPVVATEQYPKGLGPTVAALAGRLPSPAHEKATFSCARDAATIEAIEATGRRTVLAVGIETHVCVLQTVLDLVQRGLAVHVPHDAVQSRRPADRDWALRRMQAAGAVVTSTESALFELLDRCDTAEFKTVSKLLKRVPVD
jgi:nicotinamidase-related amidase